MSKGNLFISWSGEYSKEIGEKLKLFFEESLQGIEPFFSPGITKGQQWLSKINNAIDNSVVGILCLTKENHTKPWVLFESGALSRVGQVCPIVFDMAKDDLKGPISIFQASDFNKKEFQQLFEDINEKCGTGLTQKVIDRIFNKGFDKLEKEISEISKSYSKGKNKSDESLLLLQQIDNKLNILLGETTDQIIVEKYISSLVRNITSITEILDSETLTNLKSQISNVIISLDFLVSELPPSKSLEELKEFIDKLNLLF